MEKLSLLLIIAFTTATVFSVQVAAVAQAGGDDEPPPPMYAAHDYASGELQKRRTIKVSQPCDAKFGTDLEGVVTKMEKNKDAGQEMANDLRQQFVDLMEKNKDKKLCERLTWCDMGTCQKRVKLQGRALEEDTAKPVDTATDAPKPAASKDTQHDVLVAAKPNSSAPADDGSTTAKTAENAATREVKAIFSTVCQFAALTIIAIVIPRNL